MENLPGTANRNFMAPPPSRAAAESTMSADPFSFDELQKRLSLIEKSMDAPKAEFETLGIEPEHMLEHLCRTMCSRGLAEHLSREMCSRGIKKHVVCDVNRLHLGQVFIHKLSDVPKLRERIRAAMKLAPSPADLVFECSKYVEDGQAFVLLMELFLQMIADGEVGIPASTEQAAHARARRWRDMYNPSGGWEEDQRIQSRAFLFFLASFGIPADFVSDYVMNLVILSYPCEVSETLRRSRVLVPMIPDMIEKMLQYKLYAEAIDVAFTFGIEDKFPPQPVIASFLAEHERASMELSRYGSVKEQENAAMHLRNSLRALNQALRDHKFRGISVSLRFGLRKLQLRMHRAAKEALKGLKSNDHSDDDGNRKRERDEMDTEAEMEHPSLARRLVISFSLRKRQRIEPVICYMI